VTCLGSRTDGRGSLDSAFVKVVLKFFETNHDNGNVVHGLLFGSKSQNFIGAFPTDLMKSHIDIALVLLDDIPNKLAYFFGAKLVKNTIAAKDNKIEILTSIFKVHNIRVANNHTWHTSKVWVFGLDITKSPRNRETAGGHPIGTYEWVIKILVCHSYKLIDSHLLDHGGRIISLKYRLRLIDSPAVRNNSFIFTWIHWFMIIS